MKLTPEGNAILVCARCSSETDKGRPPIPGQDDSGYVCGACHRPKELPYAGLHGRMATWPAPFERTEGPCTECNASVPCVCLTDAYGAVRYPEFCAGCLRRALAVVETPAETETETETEGGDR